LSVNGEYQTKPDVAVVVFGEEPYAEGNGDLDNLEYQRLNKTDLALLKRLNKAGIPVVSIFITGRPLWVNAELNESDAFVVAWLPGSEGQGVADVIVADSEGKPRLDFKGKLSFSWPKMPDQTSVNLGDSEYQPLFKYGYGLTYDSKETIGTLNTDVAVTEVSNQDFELLKNAIKAPMKLSIGLGDKRKVMTSSVIENDNVHIRTIDRLVQEDARQISFSGKGAERVAIGQDFPSDLASYAEQNGALSVLVKIDKPLAENALLVGVECGEKCDRGIDVSAVLDSQKLGEWQRLNIALSCFTNQGVNLRSVFEPFVMFSAKKLKVAIADIAVVVNQKTNNSKCKNNN
jgi:beta-glucosidase